MSKKPEETEIVVQPLRRATIKLRIVGTTPLFQNRLSEKMRQYFPHWRYWSQDQG